MYTYTSQIHCFHRVHKIMRSIGSRDSIKTSVIICDMDLGVKNIVSFNAVSGKLMSTSIWCLVKP